MILLPIFLLFSIIGLSAASECPSGWIFNPSTTECYYFSTKLYTFDESVQFCSSIGGKSVSIDTYAERDALVAMTNTTMLQPWLGSRRNTTNNQFYNIDHSYFYSFMWTKNEPSVNGDCVTFKGATPFGLQVTQCYQFQPAFCKQTPALCNGGVFGGSDKWTGTIQSPGYPVQYYNNLNCNYLIISPNNTFITILFSPFLVEEWYDLVDVFDGNSTNYVDHIGQVSSYNLARGFESSTNMMTVRFKTNYDITDKGWLATWKAKKDMPVISQSGSNGTMVSPNYPLTYDSYDEQVYQISVAWGMQVNLTIDVFRTENKYDYLNIYNSTTQSNSTLVTTLSGQSVAPFNYISPRSYMSMKFVSDGSLQYTGWHAFWSIC
ncbi:C-type LECtin [Caenorhabditis elegans]|uniref:C-type LECtin n=1 Tax=Caenorhabditis elegans TaxID=6239 RepID=Q19229_CAEEL|nr:C-type LECtin [Caenorhabditis elegans]CAB01148.2 C-type LECtin [Caenorhabditis elegans]|eukprot:NP_506587.2 C-type LECtin [Caenorhabditis elegans]